MLPQPGALIMLSFRVLMDDLSLCLLSLSALHGKMGLHLKFKTIFNSVMRAKNLLDHLIPDEI